MRDILLLWACPTTDNAEALELLDFLICCLFNSKGDNLKLNNFKRLPF